MNKDLLAQSSPLCSNLISMENKMLLNIRFDIIVRPQQILNTELSKCSLKSSFRWFDFKEVSNTSPKSSMNLQGVE